VVPDNAFVSAEPPRRLETYNRARDLEIASLEKRRRGRKQSDKLRFRGWVFRNHRTQRTRLLKWVANRQFKRAVLIEFEEHVGVGERSQAMADEEGGAAYHQPIHCRENVGFGSSVQ
jgi:hypothetical protein